ncbi:ATP-binding protein [Paenibacillus whitsoniae]|uniref:AAA family ATPase n=1 Tax=Paenibacillus whitsoniae TaxID=2496558 RepID=A0A430JAZ2_9BACL|nr:ATP-binding protein [Paenibacillus whitsoniae]RTE08234.1 AAA family ATPase [Paenibacillus whitsoniae]
MSYLIFIGGIHGVGKTTICNELVNACQIPVYSASRIISALKNKDLPADKLIPDIDLNQALLIEGLKEVKTRESAFILDGHFCLINEKRTISKISEAVFQKLEPIACIVITDNVNNISKRLKMRDNIDYDASFIRRFQDEEIHHAIFLANKLNIPHYIFNQSLNSATQLLNFIEGLGVMK